VDVESNSGHDKHVVAFPTQMSRILKTSHDVTTTRLTKVTHCLEKRTNINYLFSSENGDLLHF